jgi:hypothetical protein
MVGAARSWDSGGRAAAVDGFGARQLQHLQHLYCTALAGAVFASE